MAQVKGKVATKNNSFKLIEVEKLLNEAISQVRGQNEFNTLNIFKIIQNEGFIHVGEDSDDKSDVDL